MESASTEICPDNDIWALFSSFHQCDENTGKQPNADDNTEFCSHCSSTRLLLDGGNYICQDCGTFFDRFIDTNAEWRYYGHDDNKTSDPTRCGLPTNDLLPESSLGTIIGNKSGECYEMKILRKYQMWNSMTYKERTLYNIFDTMTVNAVNNGIPASIIEEAKALYKKISEMKISRGDNRSGLIASSIYMSMKKNKVPRSAKEIAKIFNLKSTTMTRGCKKFQDVLQMEVESTTPSDFIQRFCSKLNLDKDVKDMCMHVVRKAEEMSIVCENTPPSIAAGCIYLVCILCNVSIYKKSLASACDISMVTISKCYKKLHKYRLYLFPAEVREKYDIV
jgi:transcription initiation factor TFIIB